MSHKNNQTESRRPAKRWWVCGGVFLGLVIAIALRIWLTSSGPAYDPIRLKAWHKVEPHLKDADASEASIVERQLDSIREFFDERRQGATAFAESALSLGGKFAWLKGAVTFDDGASHRQYLIESFQKHVFRGEDLRAVLAGAVTRTLDDLKSLENNLLTQIRLDVSDADLLLGNSLPALQSDEAFFRVYENAAKEVLSVMAREMGITIGQEVVSWVAADIAAQVIARIGTSAGILGAGAASGLATLGIGVGVALLVDMILDFLLKRIGHDPVNEVAQKVRDSLDRTRDFLTNGAPAAVRVYTRLRDLEQTDLFSEVRAECGRAAAIVEKGGQLGLRHELRKLCESQSRVRREALRKIILVQGGLP